MKALKKIFAPLFLAMLLFSALAACGGGGETSDAAGVVQPPAASAPPAAAPATPPPTESPKAEETPAPEAAPLPAGEPITLNVALCRDGGAVRDWFNSSGNGTGGEKGFAARFEAETPGVRLELELIAPGEVDSAVDARIAAGNPPDLLILDAFSDYAGEELLLPVEDYCPEELYADFLPALLGQSVIDGTAYALPALAGEYVMYCNAALLKEAGAEIPETWTELETAAQAILDHFNDKNDGDEIYPWGVDLTTGAGEATFACYAWNNGGGFLDAQGRWAVNSDANVEALEYAVSLIDRGYTNPAPSTQNLSDLQEMFLAGRLAMLIAPRQFPAAWEAAVSKSGGGTGFITAPIPRAEGSASSAVGTLDYLMAFRDDSASDQSARNEAIGKFLRFFYAPDNYTAWVRAENGLPVTVSAAAAMSGDGDPVLAGWAATAETRRFFPVARPEWLLVKQGIIFAEQNALIGGEVRAELDALQAQLTG